MCNQKTSDDRDLVDLYQLASRMQVAFFALMGLSIPAFALLSNASPVFSETIKDLQDLQKGSNTKIVKVDEIGDLLIRASRNDADTALIYYTLTHIHAQAGMKLPEKIIEYGELGLSYPSLNLIDRMKLYVYVGDAFRVLDSKANYTEKRKAAAVVYLKGLKEIEFLKSPEKVKKGPVGGNDLLEMLKKNKENKEEQTIKAIANIKAVLINQLRDMYKKQPYDKTSLVILSSNSLTNDELKELITKDIPEKPNSPQDRLDWIFYSAVLIIGYLAIFAYFRIKHRGFKKASET